MMKSPEEAIGRVLAGLRASDAPLGMERRILKAVQDHASARSRWGWRWLRPIWLLTPAPPTVRSSLFFGVALTGMLAVVVAIPLHYRSQWVRGPSGQLKMTPTSTGSLPIATPGRLANNSEVPPPASIMRPPVKRQERTVGLVRKNDSLAVREMQAASRPAPPLPLTKEEKLLLRVVHTGGPEELAMLNPDERARREAESEAEFQQFFRQSTAKDNEQN